jgi:hypothetical protein
MGPTLRVSGGSGRAWAHGQDARAETQSPTSPQHSNARTPLATRAADGSAVAIDNSRYLDEQRCKLDLLLRILERGHQIGVAEEAGRENLITMLCCQLGGACWLSVGRGVCCVVSWAGR